MDSHSGVEVPSSAGPKVSETSTIVNSQESFASISPKVVTLLNKGLSPDTVAEVERMKGGG